MYHSRYDSRNRTFIRGGRVTDGTVVWKIKDIRCPYSLGEFVFKMNEPKDYEYLLLCDGSTISEENYPELVAVLGGTQLPNLIDGFLQGSATTGTYKEAGLPNIAGMIAAMVKDNSVDVSTSSALGAFAFGSTSELVGNGGAYTGYRSATLRLNANAFNAIYGNSYTVQPPAYTAKIYICYAG